MVRPCDYAYSLREAAVGIAMCRTHYVYDALTEPRVRALYCYLACAICERKIACGHRWQIADDARADDSWQRGLPVLPTTSRFQNNRQINE